MEVLARRGVPPGPTGNRLASVGGECAPTKSRRASEREGAGSLRPLRMSGGQSERRILLVSSGSRLEPERLDGQAFADRTTLSPGCQRSSGILLIPGDRGGGQPLGAGCRAALRARTATWTARRRRPPARPFRSAFSRARLARVTMSGPAQPRGRCGRFRTRRVRRALPRIGPSATSSIQTGWIRWVPGPTDRNQRRVAGRCGRSAGERPRRGRRTKLGRTTTSRSSASDPATASPPRPTRLRSRARDPWSRGARHRGALHEHGCAPRPALRGAAATRSGGRPRHRCARSPAGAAGGGGRRSPGGRRCCTPSSAARHRLGARGDRAGCELGAHASRRPCPGRGLSGLEGDRTGRFPGAEGVDDSPPDETGFPLP